MSEERSRIYNRIKSAPLAHNGYEELGDYLRDKNLKQAYLCYENAEFFCDDDTDKMRIQSKMESASMMGGRVPKTAIVILNYKLLDMTKACIESIRKTVSTKSAEIVVVDNGSKDESLEWLKQQKDIVLVANDENLGFPKGCNVGIEAAGDGEDILLLNNDTVMFHNTLFWLRMGMYKDDSHGVMGSVTNAAYPEPVVDDSQSVEYYENFAISYNVPMENNLEYMYFVAGFCMLLRHEFVAKIGGLSEDYGLGYGEDNDICLNAIKNGYLVALVHNSFVVHWGSKSFGKKEGISELKRRNLQHFEDKYGVQCGVYNMKNDLYSALNAMEIESGKVLVINCDMGTSLLRYKWEHPGVSFDVWDSTMQGANYASKQKVINVNIYEKVREIKYSQSEYDFVIICLRMGDQYKLEEYFSAVKDAFNENGRVIIVADNVRYYLNWMGIVKHGIIPHNLVGGFSSVNEADSFLNDNGFWIKKWTMSYAYPFEAEEKSMLENVSTVLGFKNSEIMIKSFVITTIRK